MILKIMRREQLNEGMQEASIITRFAKFYSRCLFFKKFTISRPDYFSDQLISYHIFVVISGAFSESIFIASVVTARKF